MNTRKRIGTILTFAFVALAIVAGPALAELLVYEPFDYASTTLTGQGGALGTVGTWHSYKAGDVSWGLYQEGTLSGALLYDQSTPVTFDGTVANLSTTGGYTGWGGRLNADIALDPSVTATFLSGNTTWLSYVTARSFDRNVEQPNLTLGTIAVPDGERGDNYGGIGTGGSGFGTGGGPNRDNRTHIYPMFYTEGQYNNVQGPIPGNSYAANTLTVVDDTGRLSWVASDADGYGAANIVVVKLEWDADTLGEDIMSIARFLEGDVISEAAFDAMILGAPNLTTANWAAENKPSLDQSQLDTITFAGIKYFVDEIRLGTTFMDVIGLLADPNAPSVDAGDDMVSWSGVSVALEPDVVEADGSNWTSLTYLWTADPDTGVVITNANQLNASVTITKAAPTGDATAVRITLAVNNDGRVEAPVTSSITIDVYDDACAAAIGAGAVFDETDLSEDCITNLRDSALMALDWLDDYAITGPVEKPVE